MITFDTITKRIRKHIILDTVSFTVEPKELVTIAGPSGAGKTMLLHMMIGATTPTEGKVIVDGVALHQLPPQALQLFRRRVGVVFQDYKLLWNRTVAENVAFPLEVCGIPDKVIDKRVEAVLRDLGLWRKADTLASTLSGSEKARTAIARAVVHHPMILLADEPTGNLDADESRMIIDLLKLIQANGTTVVVATSQPDVAKELGGRIVHLDNGKIVHEGDAATKEVAPKESQKIETPKIASKPATKKKVKITALG